MAKRAAPWWWEEKKAWYYKSEGKRHRIGPHPEGAVKPKKTKGKWNTPKEIIEQFHQMMVDGGRQEVEDNESVAAVLDDFLSWCYENRAPRTADRYRDFIQEFVTEHGRTSVSELNTSHVTSWLASKDTWNSTTKYNALTALQRGFNWAVKNRHLARNPIKGMEKPKPKARSSTISEEVFEELLSLIADQNFQDLCIVSYDTGGRPQEIKSIEARHVDLKQELVLIPTEETKGRHRRRLIHIPTKRTLEILQRRCEQFPSGPIFRNKLGNKWTGMAVKCRFEDLEVAFGQKEMERQGIESKITEKAIEKYMKTLNPMKKEKSTGMMVKKDRRELRREAGQKMMREEAVPYGVRIKQYDFRRTYITDSLIAGVDSHVVAQLSGHSSTAMIDKHYSAVAEDLKFMKEQAKKARPDH